MLKELRNYYRELFLCPSQKYVRTQPTFSTAVFQNEFRVCYINQIPAYRKLNLRLVNSIYLVFFNL